MSSGKWRLFGLGLNVLNISGSIPAICDKGLLRLPQISFLLSTKHNVQLYIVAISCIKISRDDVIKIFSALLAICAEFTGEFPAQSPVTRSFGVFFDLCLIQRLSKQSWG